MNVTETTKSVVLDDELPGLRLALDKEAARKVFKRRLPSLSREGKLRLKKIRLIRHKPGRRCVAEYEVVVKIPNTPEQRITLIGKTRARRSGNEGFRLQKALWDAGFDSQSRDNISVPEPIGVISDFQMWFQRKVNGPTAEQLLASPDGVVLAKRVAQAIHKLHRVNVPTDKIHTMDHELNILGNCLAQVSALNPEWSQRLERLIASCKQLGGGIQPGGNCGIHRDFYAAQVILDTDRLWLLDFDLYCMGDPSLDAGNFIGHITEQSLREYGRADGLIDAEQALEDEFVRLSGEGTRRPLHAYRDLTLARHIFLSTKFPERRHLTEKLLALCETRLL
jgi:hypothetical protein